MARRRSTVARVLATTGTKGKSTTTAVVGHLLDRWGYRVVVGGNIGLPPWDPSVPADADWWVIEVSSYQATDVGHRPGRWWPSRPCTPTT